MIGLRVIEPGLLTTVQDLGRPRHTALGVPPSGATDPLSLVVGNRSLGNMDDDAAIECTLIGPVVEIDRDAWICLTGATCPDARIETRGASRTLPWCTPTFVSAGERLDVGRLENGARCLLCISGGVSVPRVLDSRSTLISAGLGGHHGRALRPNDMLALNSTARTPRRPTDDLHEWLRTRLARKTLRAMPSLHAEHFPLDALDGLTSIPFTVSRQCDRIGVRLNEPINSLPHDPARFESEPTTTGGIQIAADGRPIVLGVDRPTTGGYPLLACVIEADLPAVAMLRPREHVRFETIALDTARELTMEHRRTLDALLPPSHAQTGTL